MEVVGKTWKLVEVDRSRWKLLGIDEKYGSSLKFMEVRGSIGSR